MYNLYIGNQKVSTVARLEEGYDLIAELFGEYDPSVLKVTIS